MRGTRDNEQRRIRLPYRAPRVRVYGPFRTLTRGKGGTIGDGSMKDSTRVLNIEPPA